MRRLFRTASLVVVLDEVDAGSRLLVLMLVTLGGGVLPTLCGGSLLMMFVNATSAAERDRHKIEDMRSYRIGSSAVPERRLDAVHERAEKEETRNGRRRGARWSQGNLRRNRRLVGPAY